MLRVQGGGRRAADRCQHCRDRLGERRGIDCPGARCCRQGTIQIIGQEWLRMIATLGIQSNLHIVQNGGVQRPRRLQDVHNGCTRHGGKHQFPLSLTFTPPPPWRFRSTWFICRDAPTCSPVCDWALIVRFFVAIFVRSPWRSSLDQEKHYRNSE